MDIPTDVVKAIRPYDFDHFNCIKKSVVYTFNKLSVYDATDTHYIFRFPYSANTYWTNYKYVLYTEDSTQPPLLNIGIGAKLLNGETYNIVPITPKEPNKWYNTKWTIPSMKINDNNYIYFQVSRSIGEFRISLLGFNCVLYPISSRYMLMPMPNILNNNGNIFFKKTEKDDEFDEIIIKPPTIYEVYTHIYPISMYPV